MADPLLMPTKLAPVYTLVLALAQPSCTPFAAGSGPCECGSKPCECAAACSSRPESHEGQAGCSQSDRDMGQGGNSQLTARLELLSLDG